MSPEMQNIRSLPELPPALPDMPPASEPASVYVVIPVFNRRETTLACVAKVEDQSYGRCIAIVADGGSTDGTPEAVRAQFPDAIVLTSKTELWWGGSARLGVDYALRCATGTDYIMLMNDDTDFADDYVERLVGAAERRQAIYGGLVVDADHPETIIDAAVKLDWSRFAFSANRDCAFEDGVFLGSDVLPGRGTLIPAWAVQNAGSVDDAGFPHYLADYEFSYRLKKVTGLSLGIVAAAKIKTKESPSSPPMSDHRGVAKQCLERLRMRFSKRSKQNVPAAWRFIDYHAPAPLRQTLKRDLVVSTLRYAALPLRQWQPRSQALKTLLNTAKRTIGWSKRTLRKLLGPYLITRADIENLGLDYLALNQHRIVIKSQHAGFFSPGRPVRYLRSRYPSAIPLYYRSANPGRKIARFLKSRYQVSRKARKLRDLLHSAKQRLAPRRIKAAIYRRIAAGIMLLKLLVGRFSTKTDRLQKQSQDKLAGLAQSSKLGAATLSTTVGSRASDVATSTEPVFVHLGLLIKRRIDWLQRVLFGPYLITRGDIEELGLDFMALNRHQIIAPAVYPGYYSPTRPSTYLSSNYPTALALYRRASRPDLKLQRAWKVRSPGTTCLNGVRMLKRAVFALWQAPVIKSEDVYRHELSVDQLMAAGKIEPLFKDRFYREAQSGERADSDCAMTARVATMLQELSTPRRRVKNQLALFRDEIRLYQHRVPMRVVGVSAPQHAG